MHHVYIIERNNEYQVHTTVEPSVFEGIPCWYKILNTNRLGGMLEINKFIDTLPARVDKHGERWICCGIETLKCAIDKIVDAPTSVRVPMLFMRRWVWRGLRALASTRRLPRDLLREVGRWMHIDDVGHMLDIFNMYTYMKSITGLYIRMVEDGKRRPRMSVSRIYSGLKPKDTTLWSCLVMFEGPYNHYVKYSAPHFYMKVEAECGRPQMVRVEFEADAAIEFVHKRLGRREAKLNHTGPIQ